MNPLSDLMLTLRGVRKYNQYLSKSCFFENEHVRKAQSKWLSKILIHAHDTIPWYSSQFRKYGVNSRGENPFAELQKLPILTKQDVHENHADFCVSGASTKSLKFTTSGTTGEPLTTYTSPAQWVIEQGVIWRQWKWAGYKFRDRIAIFRSYSPKANQPSMRVDRLKNWAYFSVFRMDDESIHQYAAFLQQWKPRFLRGYPSSLLLVAQHAIHYHWKLPGLKAAFTASECVPDLLREKLREAFGIEVFDHYGQ